MEIWIKQGSQKLRFPVLPSEYTVSGTQVNTVVNINDLGEINLLGKPGLRGISFSSFFPAAYESYCEYTGIKKPKRYVEQIEEMKQNGSMKLHITGIISMNVTIESMEYGENDGTGDIFFSAEFKEYRTLNIPVSTLSTQTDLSSLVVKVLEAVTSRPAKSVTAGNYEVKKGDTLTGIARKEMGTTDWHPLYNANKSVIGGNPNVIQVGMVLTIPGR